MAVDAVRETAEESSFPVVVDETEDVFEDVEANRRQVS
jgi:hypothetical protein